MSDNEVNILLEDLKALRAQLVQINDKLNPLINRIETLEYRQKNIIASAKLIGYIAATVLGSLSGGVLSLLIKLAATYLRIQ